MTIAAAAAGVHDLVVVDAFSSDAIPVHLVTREAVATYRRALTPDGLLVFHVSNRYFDLFPVVARLASDAGLVALGRAGTGTVDGALATRAVAIGPEGPAMAAVRSIAGWREVPPGPALWTDDRSDVLGAL